MFQASRSLFYDEAPVFGGTIDDIDRDRVMSFLQRMGVSPTELPFETLLRNLRLSAGEDNIPTVAGILSFGKRPCDFIPYAYVQAARIPGADLASAPMDTKTLNGTLFDILEESSRFLRMHLSQRHDIRRFEPEISREMPEEALREACVNLLAHRDYTVSAPARLLIFDNRVEFRSPGGLPNTVTVEAMRLGAVHVLRNPTIYTLFARSGFVTGVGSGVFRMIKLMKSMGKEVGLQVQAGEFVVTLPRDS